MKKLLFITPNFLPNKLTGSDEFIRLVSKNLKDEFEITVITLRGTNAAYLFNPFTQKLPKEEIIDGINVFRLNNNHFKNLIIIFFKILFKNIDLYILEKIFSKKFIEYINFYLGPQFIGLEKFLEKNKFDTIHIGPMPYEFPNYVVYLHKKLKLKSKLVTTPFFHDLQEIYYSKLFENYLKSCDVIHVVTQPEKNNLLKAFDLDESKIKVIPLFLDIKEFTDDDSLESDVKKFKDSNSLQFKVIILGLNQGGPETKGFEYTLKALNSLADEYENLCLLSIGNNKIETQKIEVNNKLQIIEIGYVRGRKKDLVFKACDIFSMPSQGESFGLVYLEAWLRKKPVLAFELSPLKSLISRGGVLCKIRNQSDVTQKIKKLIDDKKYRETLGLQGFQALKENYSLESVIKDYKKIFY